MLDTRVLFRIVVWLGVIANWSFGLWVLFGDGNNLLAMLRLGRQDSMLWLYNYSILLMILSLFYIPAARDPFRYRANAWLLVVGRLVPATTFLLGVALGYMPNGFLTLFIADGAFGLIELFLLLQIFRDGPRPRDYGYRQ
ncbi:hypothetical protein MesoLj113a_44760 [Mesorhizobium sp. 113-1-2]|uniref:hypothetical protein n=1 Tax=Mesorhizobium sp. 113-1-2 TaxID=2744515 RepID=UPI0008199B66|nr:hypothetical protein [Mesorhizobium sp. 113-1-2]BAV45438.1 Uncharacterized protein MLTONO_0535 [Mesorhizobium loti]BCG73318.1 hypothetical protein MesoLj113a_44760 [Mesorhizobium sp. 113-1-2]